MAQTRNLAGYKLHVDILENYDMFVSCLYSRFVYFKWKRNCQLQNEMKVIILMLIYSLTKAEIEGLPTIFV